MGLPLPCWRSSEVGACPCDAPSSARRGGRGRVPGVPEELELIESPIIGGEEENRDGGLVSTAAAEAESSGQRVATPKRCTGRPRACTQPRKCAGSWRQEIRNLSTVGGEHQDQALPAASRQLRSTMNPQFAPPSARRVGELPRRVRSCYFRTGVTDVLAMFHPPPVNGTALRSPFLVAWKVSVPRFRSTSGQRKESNSPLLAPVAKASMTTKYRYGLRLTWQAVRRLCRSLSLRKRTLPRGFLGLLTLRRGESSSHYHSLTAMVKTWDNAAR
jgi:hypothetical protein